MASVDIGVVGGHVLRYGVLGLLIERRGYGYELVQRLVERLGSSWQLNASGVYTALDQLLAAGLIEVVSGGQGTARRAARVVYGVTERGIDEFNAWLARPSYRVEPIRSELALKIALAAPDNVPPLLAAIAHEEMLIARSLSEERCETPAREGSDGWPVAAGALVSAAAARRLQCELDWLAAVRETLQRMLVESFTARAELAHTASPG